MLTKLVLATVAITSLVQVKATMAPSYPEPGTVWKAGQTYKIVWKEDKSEPSIDDKWRDFKIDLMTGDNLQQQFLMNIATGLDGKRQQFYRFQAPDVHPHSHIYFLMFTNDQGDNAWTTRFAITEEGSEVVEPENPTQPDGDAIPWGVGRLGKDPELVSKINSTAMEVQVAEGAELNANAIEPENAVDQAEVEVLQATSPDLLQNNEDGSSGNDEAPLAENQPQQQTSGVSGLVQPSVGVLLCGLLAKLLFLL